MKTLVAYFSASGVTQKLAEALAKATGADLFAIVPEKPYTEADLKYMNPLARCNKEKLGRKDVPIAGSIENFDQYDVVLLGFPIWYAGAPNVINTFAKSYDWKGKRIGIFATSGGSGIGKTAAKLQPFVEGAEITDAQVNLPLDKDSLKAWAEKIIASSIENLEKWAETI